RYRADGAAPLFSAPLRPDRLPWAWALQQSLLGPLLGKRRFGGGLCLMQSLKPLELAADGPLARTTLSCLRGQGRNPRSQLLGGHPLELCQLPQPLHRANAGDLLPGLANLRRRLQTIRRRLKAELEHVFLGIL